jgi:hypothetical protein
VPLLPRPPLVHWLCHLRPASDMHSRAAFPRARPSPPTTFPPWGVGATCRPSTSTNRNNSRAHPRTSATSAKELASSRCRVTRLRVDDPSRGLPGEANKPSHTLLGVAWPFGCHPRRNDRSSRRIYPRSCCLGHLVVAKRYPRHLELVLRAVARLSTSPAALVYGATLMGKHSA